MNAIGKSDAKLRLLKVNHFHDNTVKNNAAAILPGGCSDGVM
jgi:hypothetical protein